MKRLAILLLLAVSPAFGSARHVYLDANSNGRLQDCPNPLHNIKGTSNTDELSYCVGAALNNAKSRLICDAASGCKAWTTTTGQCTSVANGGTVTNVTNGVSINLEATGTGVQDLHVFYGHPQACVYNMAPSDSCEIHAGTYRKAGAFASENSLTTDGQTEGTCGRSTCWKSFVVAFGTGPNLANNGYGTISSPAYLRGAVFNSSTDTWDSDSDKIPDCNGNTGTAVCSVSGEPTSYPPIFNGDTDADGVFDDNVSSGGANDTAVNAGWNITSGAGYTGDIFYAVIIGCGDPGYNNYCRTSAVRTTANDWIKIDTDADGVMDTNYGVVSSGSSYPATNYLFTKDIEVTRMNGGDAKSSPGLRQAGGNFTAQGNRFSDGLDIDHVYVHDNAYSSCAITGGGCETVWAIFHDQENNGCTVPWVIKNSLLYQNNENVFNDDCGSNSECGCGQYVHDNRIIVDVATSGGRTIHMAYWKGIDTIHEEVGLTPVKKKFAFSNNETIFRNIPGDYLFHDLQSFGNQRGHGLGEVWVYGNVFRVDPNFANSSGSRRLELSFTDSSHPATEGSWKYYLFNNTYDWNKEMEAMMNNGSTGTRLVEKNNAYFRATSVHLTTAATTIVRTTATEICSVAATGCTTASSTRTVWFTPGAYASGNPTFWNGLANYVPVASGPLDGAGSCDPDGNGVQGVDWNYDGTEETTWTDIYGNVVNCASGSQDVGAIQNSTSGSSPVCGNGARETGETCDGSDLNSQTCVTQGYALGTLGCCDGTSDTSFCTTSNCSAFDIGNCSNPSPERAIKRGVIFRGVVVR